MRTIAALDGKVRRAVDLRRHGGIRGRKKLSEPLAVAAMHGRDHAQQTRIGRGIVDKTADENFEQGRSEAHPIIENLQLWRHGNDQRCLSEPGQRLSVGCRQVGISGGTGLIGRPPQNLNQNLWVASIPIPDPRKSNHIASLSAAR